MLISPPMGKSRFMTSSWSYLFSLLCHLVIILSFVFTFPTRPVAHKPLFVFLGSILESQDFILTPRLVGRRDSLPAGRQAPPTPPLAGWGSTNPVSQEDTGRIKQTQFSAGVIKPVFSKNVKKGSKNFLKSTFEETLVEKREEERAIKELGIELTVPEYRPLRLDRSR